MMIFLSIGIGLEKMDKSYKVVPYQVINHNDAIVDENEPWNNMPAYNSYEKRFRIVSTETGEILDDAQGYGYKTAEKAHAAYAYKTRDKSKDKEKQAKKRHIQHWLKEHKDFAEAMEDVALDVAKGVYKKFDAALVKKLLAEFELTPDFTAGELLKVWEVTEVE